MSGIHTWRLAGLAGLTAAVALATAPAMAHAQYFGQNKVQYDHFDFRILHTDHFDLYFYPAESLATADAARMAERWYVRHSRTFEHSFQRKPVIFYADQPDFQQTNVIGGFIGQGTGGVTEPLRDRVVMPFTGVYQDNDHVLGHELVHVFQFDIAGSQGGGGLAQMDRLPQWAIEGMAEYLSLGRNDPLTAMWLRDAALRNDLPTIKKLNTDPRYFPYRYGEALWAYIGGVWGDNIIRTIYRNALKGGLDPALKRVLGLSSDSLSAKWLAQIRADYLPLMQGRTDPKDLPGRILNSQNKTGDMDVSPVLSPDGKYVAFFTQRGLLETDLYVADAETGRIVKKLTSPNRAHHFDEVSFINSAGSWSPDGKQFAFVVQEGGDDAIQIFNVDSRSVVRTIKVKSVGEITGPAWGPGNRMVFSGSSGGISDLYLLDLNSEQVRQLTRDRFGDIQPAWSPDGRTIAFATDRFTTNLDSLRYGAMQLALMDVASGEIKRVPVFDGPKHINPQFSPDGTSLFFVSDRGGFNDIYRVSLADGAVFQVTNIATGISGITALSPAISVAQQTGRMAFTVFTRGGNDIYRAEAAQTQGTPVQPSTTTIATAAALPPLSADDSGMVTTAVHDPATGLQPPGEYKRSSYRPSLALEQIGNVGIGVAFGGPFGTQYGGGISAYAGDMLENNIVAASLSQNGNSLRDFGGQLLYLNQGHRWNFLAGYVHAPFITGGLIFGDTTLTDNAGNQVPGQFEAQVLQRTYLDQVAVGTQYPLSQTHRFEFNLSANHIGYNIEEDRLTAVGGQIIDESVVQLPHPPGLTYYQGTAAFVGDYSYFGFTSPIAGARYRLEVDPTFGSLSYEGVLADLRRYFFLRPVSFAFRAVHYGRYGSGSDDPRLYPIYLGDEQLVRGYSTGSINIGECGAQVNINGTCPVFDRLVGSRIAVANAELRIPLFGTEQLGLINFPYLPTEIAPFFDAGVAWTSTQSPTIEFARNTDKRVPVFSTGVSARVNLLGYAVLEVYWAKPFQRPGRSSVWGFQVAPGW